jgi:hypothetical protein
MKLIPVSVFKSASQGLEIFRCLLRNIQYSIPCFEVQKGAIEDDLEFLPILPIFFHLQVLEEEHAKNFVNVHCSVVPAADCTRLNSGGAIIFSADSTALFQTRSRRITSLRVKTFLSKAPNAKFRKD